MLLAGYTILHLALHDLLIKMHMQSWNDVMFVWWGCADTHGSAEDLEEEDADTDAGVGVLAPGKAAAKAAQQKARDGQQKHGEAERAGGDSAVPSVPGEPAQRPQSRAKEHAGFEVVPLQADRAGSSDDSDSDSDAGLAEMDDHSRAEVCACRKPVPDMA